ncbi:cobalamin B12-binding domain-containing protein [Priestia sp. Y58]|uniref:cobalamin B12-binding domain-containing protein n=1 Tax=Priestia sp. Y58 TaxID=2922804 RepID=UPI0024063178|nr:cobalamin B12-binding domain-containing protein [Priestia sp. Y58]MDG0029413.1 cobalamin B12-binding domain-containing protein [Priestia sp. Y58]
MKSQVQKFVGYLLAGDQDSAWEVVLEEIHQGNNSLDIYENLITTAMRVTGDMWEENIISVADEHVATTTCDYVLTRYRFYKKIQGHASDTAPRALLLCLEQEQHFIGLKMVALLFEEHGWNTRFLGANLPLEYAEKMAIEWKPHMVGLSVSIPYHIERLAEYTKTLDKLEPRPTVMVGGRLVSQIDFRSYCSEHTRLIPDLHQLNNWLISYHKGVEVNVDA